MAGSWSRPQRSPALPGLSEARSGSILSAVPWLCVRSGGALQRWIVERRSCECTCAHRQCAERAKAGEESVSESHGKEALSPPEVPVPVVLAGGVCRGYGKGRGSVS